MSVSLGGFSWDHNCQGVLTFGYTEGTRTQVTLTLGAYSRGEPKSKASENARLRMSDNRVKGSRPPLPGNIVVVVEVSGQMVCVLIRSSASV